MRIALPDAIDARGLAALRPGMRVQALAGATMGTTWRIRFAAHGVDPAAIEAAVVARLDALVGETSHWDAGSALCAFNRAPAGRWRHLPRDLATVIGAALDLAAASDGAFDPAIGALVDLWGHGPPGPVDAAPGPAAIAAARARGGWRRLAWDPAAARLRQPGGLALDLSGIAKGHAVDALVALLGDLGIANALVEIGGELAGRGMKPDGEPWWVDLETPPGIDAAPLRVALHGLAVATSGSYVRGAHNLDPRTGRPATGVIAASVIAERAMMADGWASALTVLGAAAGIALADARGIAARLVTADREYLSARLVAMLAG